MTTLAPRLPANRGWCDPKRLPRGPNGRALCRHCKTEVPRGCRTFCSDPCVKAWRLARDPGYQRNCVCERDVGICALCGIDTLLLRKMLVTALRLRYGGGRTSRRVEAWLRALRVAGWPKGFADRMTLWDMDHIVPVAEGGGSCGMENLRTLCMRCHRTQTAALARRRSRGAR